MTPRELLAALPKPNDRTGVGPHVRRIASKVLSPHTVRGALREMRGLGTHIALYPLGWRKTQLQAHTGDGSGTHEIPVVLVHGYFHNRSGFFFMARTLRRAGFRWVYGMNYNPLGETIPSLAARLARHVDEVIRVSGAPKVHLVGHSLGGLVVRWYVQELAGHRFVDHAVTIGTPHDGTYMAYVGLGETAREMRPGSSLLRRLARGLERCPVHLVNLYSDLDVLIVPPSSAVLPESDNVHNHLIEDLGHTSLLISPDLITLIAEHLATAVVDVPLAEVKEFPADGAAGGLEELGDENVAES